MSKGIKMVTPTGTIKFPKIETAQAIDPKTKEPTVTKKYSIALVLEPDKPGMKAMLEAIDFALAESKYPKNNGKKLYKEDMDKNPETGEWDVPNGKIILNFRSNYPIRYYDAKGTPLKDVAVGYGTIAKISFELCEVPQYKCLTKYIKGIQILELKEGGMSAEACGFTEEEGYTTTPTTGEDPWRTEEA